MSDRYSVNISIGGPIGCTDAARLARLAIESGAGHDWGESWGSLKPKDVLKHMKLLANDTLDLYDNQGNLNTFDEIREFCQKHDLTYIEHEDAYGELPECYLFWAPGMESEELIPCADSRPCIEVEELKKTIAESEASFGTVSPDPAVVLEAITKLISKYTLPDLPALTRKEAPVAEGR